MHKLDTFGPNFDQPVPSPFCMKEMALLKMPGLDYETGQCDPRKAPKKKCPVLVDNDEVVPDTAYIR